MCDHKNTLVFSRGGRYLIGGDVSDDFREGLVCLDCHEVLIDPDDIKVEKCDICRGQIIDEWMDRGGRRFKIQCENCGNVWISDHEEIERDNSISGEAIDHAPSSQPAS